MRTSASVSLPSPFTKTLYLDIGIWSNLHWNEIYHFREKTETSLSSARFSYQIYSCTLFEQLALTSNLFSRTQKSQSGVSVFWIKNFSNLICYETLVIGLCSEYARGDARNVILDKLAMAVFLPRWKQFYLIFTGPHRITLFSEVSPLYRDWQSIKNDKVQLSLKVKEFFRVHVTSGIDTDVTF